MKIDHVCIAVKKLDKSAARFCELFGYRPRTEPVVNTRQKVRVQFLEKPESMDIKLIEPAGEDSPLWQTLRRGEGLHHICFRAEKLDDALQELTEKGARVLAPAQPGEAFDDESIAFLFAGMGLNVEIIDTDKRRGLLKTAPETQDTTTKTELLP